MKIVGKGYSINTISVIEQRTSVSAAFSSSINVALTGHPRRYEKDTPFSRYRPPRRKKNTEGGQEEAKRTMKKERMRKRERQKETEQGDGKRRVGPVRCVFRSVPSLSFTVASACPFVIYVCFMTRRIRKRLIKDSRVAAHELLAHRQTWLMRNIVSFSTCHVENKHLVIMDPSIILTRVL